MLLKNTKPTPTFSLRHFPMNVASKLIRSSEMFEEGSIQLSETTEKFKIAIEKICGLYNGIDDVAMDNCNYALEHDNSILKRVSPKDIQCSLIIPQEYVEFDNDKFCVYLSDSFGKDMYCKEMVDSVILFVNNQVIFNINRNSYIFKKGNAIVKVNVENLPKLIESFFECLTIKK